MVHVLVPKGKLENGEYHSFIDSDEPADTFCDLMNQYCGNL